MRRTHGEPGSAVVTRVVPRFRGSLFSVFLVLCLSSRFVSFPFVPGRIEKRALTLRASTRCVFTTGTLRRSGERFTTSTRVHGYSPRRTDSFASRPSRITEFREISNATCCSFARRSSATRYTRLSASRRIKNNAPQALNVSWKTYELREKSSGRFARPSAMPMERSASQRNVHAARKAASRGEKTSDSFVAGKAKRKGYVRISKRQRWSLIPPGKGSNRNSKSKYSRCPPCTAYDEERFISAKTKNEQGRSGFIASTTARAISVLLSRGPNGDEANEQIARISRKKGRRELAQAGEMK